MLYFLAGFFTAVVLAIVAIGGVLWSVRIRKDRLCPSCQGACTDDDGKRCGDCYGAGELDPA